MNWGSSKTYFSLLPILIILLETSLVQSAGSRRGTSFRTFNGDNITFEGETVTFLCSQYGLEDHTNIHIYKDSGEEITITTFPNGTQAVAIGTLNNISSNMTLYCNISGDTVASVELSIFALPRETSPHCFSNYSNGLIEGESVQLTCYNDSPYGVWKTSGDRLVEPFSRKFIRTFTTRTTTTIRPSVEENGTSYSCISNDPNHGVASCSIGPIFVYSGIHLSFEPNSGPSKVLSPGESRKFYCLSSPSSSVQWVEVPQNDGLIFGIDGPSLSVSVLSNNTATGNITVSCFSELLGVQESAMLTLQIIGISTPAEAVTVGTMHNIPFIPTVSTTSKSQTELDNLVILIILGVFGGILVVIFIFLLTLYCYKCRKIETTAKTVDASSKVATGENTSTHSLGPRSDIYTVVNTKKEKDEDGGFIDKNGYNVTGYEHGFPSKSPEYAFIDKSRRITINSAYLDD